MWLTLLGVAAAAPSFDAERGLVELPFELTISPSSPELSVHVTTDGSAPDASAAVVEGPLLIEASGPVSAVEIDEDGVASEVVTHTYLSPEDLLTQPEMDPRVTEDPVYRPALLESLESTPTLALTIGGPPSQTEAEVAVEWLDPEGEDLALRAGLTIEGGTSVGYPKNSLRLHFRGDYGSPRLELELYEEVATGVWPEDRFDVLNLRSGSHDSTMYLGTRGQYLRNRWMDETQLEMGHLVPHGRFVHLTLDGVYWGLYHLRERFNDAFMADYLGGEEAAYEAINSCDVIDGSGAAWGSLVAASSSWEQASQWVQADHFVDYMLLNFYAANAWDWYDCHNWMAAGPTAPGEGGLRFHSSDSDICLVYEVDTDITHLAGPGGVFGALVAEGHPDFLIKVADRVHAALFDEGPLTPEAAVARYEALASSIEGLVVGESARWGQGWWERDGDWTTERDRLLRDFFPGRSAALLDQLRARGLYPLDAPVFSEPAGWAFSGAVVTMSAPEGVEAELYWTTDGSDPRLPGGGLSPTAEGPTTEARLTLEGPTLLRARLRQGEVWGALNEAWYEVDLDPAVLVNEWSAVAPGELPAEGDARLGEMPGNGGDWVELVVVEEEGVDLRGWRLELSDRLGPSGAWVFGEDPLWEGLSPGTLITLGPELPSQADLDPAAGGWWVHAQVDAEDGLVRAEGQPRITHLDQTFLLRDAEGAVVFGPVGEGIAPRTGISSAEVGVLQRDPSRQVRRFGGYGDSDRSTLGLPNVWEGGAQDLDALRGLEPQPFGDSGGAESGSDPPLRDSGQGGEINQRGCGLGAGGVGLWGLAALLVGLRARPRDQSTSPTLV